MDEKEIQRLVETTTFEAVTDNTITDADELLEELEAVRQQGYAVNDEENLEGLRAIGASVTGTQGVIGAISVSGPKPRMTGEWFREELPNILLGATNEIELNLSQA